eukprot:s2947_g6.t1
MRQLRALPAITSQAPAKCKRSAVTPRSREALLQQSILQDQRYLCYRLVIMQQLSLRTSSSRLPLQSGSRCMS